MITYYTKIIETDDMPHNEIMAHTYMPKKWHRLTPK